MRIEGSIKERSRQEEIMDDLSVNGVELERTLKAIERINKWLGGTKNGLSSVSRALRNRKKDEAFTLIDMGCGSGDFLSAMRKWGKSKGWHVDLKGIDANAHIVEIARKQCDSSIQIEQADVFSYDVTHSGSTMVICSLFLHHFSDEEIIELLKKWRQSEIESIIINDLQRSLVAVYLFRLVAFVFRFPAMAKFDGELSIRKGFSKNELKELAHKSGFKNYTLRWSWAFRYQLILTR